MAEREKILFSYGFAPSCDVLFKNSDEMHLAGKRESNAWMCPWPFLGFFGVAFPGYFSETVKS